MRFRTLLHRIVPLALIVAFVGAVSAADWARFRGPNGTGIATDKDVPVEFSPKKNLLWKVEIPGAGNSSPIVSKGKVFLQTSSADKKQRSLLCLDATNGQVLWSKSQPGQAGHIHQKNSLASNTPAADGERIYTVFWDGSHQHLSAWDYTGKQIWTRDLGALTSDHGSGVSPIVVGDKVIINNDQGNREVKGPSALQAFDAKTGKSAWSKERDPERICYSTPFLLEKVDAGPELVVATTGGVTAYDPSSGTQIWHHDWKFEKMRLRTVGSPIEHQGMIFAIAGDGGGDRNMIALKPTGKGQEPALLWQLKKGTAYVPTPLAKDGYLFWIDDKVNIAICADAKTGTEVWSERLGSDSVSSSPVMIDGKIYVITEKGTVYVFKASKDFEQLGKNDLGEGVFATPAVADGKLYIRGQKTLYCFGKK